MKNRITLYRMTAAALLMALVFVLGMTPLGLIPLGFINVGRPAKEGDEVAKVRIIVPHDKGHAYATQYVYPCLYDITYELGR